MWKCLDLLKKARSKTLKFPTRWTIHRHRLQVARKSLVISSACWTLSSRRKKWSRRPLNWIPLASRVQPRKAEERTTRWRKLANSMNSCPRNNQVPIRRTLWRKVTASITWGAQTLDWIAQRSESLRILYMAANRSKSLRGVTPGKLLTQTIWSSIGYSTKSIVWWETRVNSLQGCGMMTLIPQSVTFPLTMCPTTISYRVQ